MTVDGVSRSLRVTDHRSRVCRDRAPAPVVVEEESASGVIRTLYAREPSEVTCEGRSGKRYAPDTMFRDECNTCSCSAGGVLSCTLMYCVGSTNDPAGD